MIPGVHATLAVRRDPDEVRESLDRDGWPWLGRPVPQGGREVRLLGPTPRTFRVRPFSPTGVGRSRTWHVVLESSQFASAIGPAITLELSVGTLASGAAGLRCYGRAASELCGSGPDHPEAMVRRAANAYVRSLLEQVALAIEGQPATDGRSPTRRQTRRRAAGVVTTTSRNGARPARESAQPSSGD